MLARLSGKFSWKLAVAFCAALVPAMALTGHLITRSLKAHLIHELTLSQLTQARLIETQVHPALAADGGNRTLHDLARRAGSACCCRVTLIGKDGAVLGDSELAFDRLARVENHASRPEVRAALAGREGSDIRQSSTIGTDLLYAAVPAGAGDRIAGVVRVAMPLTQVRGKISETRSIVAWITFWMMLLALCSALFLSNSLAKPVAEMSRVAERLAQGDHKARVRALPADEHGRLGRTLNLLGERIESTVQDLTREKSELTLILSTMVEAVVAVDAGSRVLAVNPAFSRLFGIKPEAARGRPLSEVLRQAQLSDILRRALGERRGCGGELRLFAPEEHVFEANALPWLEDGEAGGAVLVLHDITRIRMLEQMRRDFVANVSHELRTPLTSISGSAETLLSGALDNASVRLDFVRSIQQDAHRLSRLVEDLLDLSAIESGKRPPRPESLSLIALANESANSLKKLAARRGVSVDVEPASGGAQVRADKDQLRQVFVNLLDNAIKFNKEGGRVRVSASSDGSSVTVSVADSGAGIPQGELPRVFERFYRVDKARSRELGGTGLGLSIVKHIVEAHGGTVSVESREGEGSIFRFTLPLAG